VFPDGQPGVGRHCIEPRRPPPDRAAQPRDAAGPAFARRVRWAAVADRGKGLGRAAGPQQRPEREIAGLGHEAQHDPREALAVSRPGRHCPAPGRDASHSPELLGLASLPTWAAVRSNLTTSGSRECRRLAAAVG
jgi:hypothetical protein